MISLPPAVKQYMVERGYSDYKKIRSLTDVDSTKDPENDPFRSMYEARKLLEELLNAIREERKNDSNQILRVLEAALLFQLALNFGACEERPNSKNLLQNCTSIIRDDPSIAMHKEAVSIAMSALMELGIMNSNIYQNADQGLSSLSEVEAIYHEYKNTVGVPPLSVDELIGPIEDIPDDEKRNSKFDRIYTHTLFYLAQVHKQLGNNDLSASYCQKTLTKQLQAGEYEANEWAINAAGLSQYFVTKNMFLQAKHCLCCANIIVEEAQTTGTSMGECGDSATMNDKSQHRADIARCWVKYYLALMENSKEKLHDDVGELDIVKQAKIYSQAELDKKSSIEEFRGMFQMPVNVGAEEEINVHQDVVTIKQAKAVFLQCKANIDVAFGFFQMDGYVTDNVELAQDTSSLYKLLLFFEPELEQKCKMHKRRADVLSGVLQEINPQFYLLLCRQLQFELGEIYFNMVDLKIEISNSANTVLSHHAEQKINKLCNTAIKYFNDFLNTLKSVGNDFPEKFDSDVERPALLARFYMARLHSKIITCDQRDKFTQVNLSYQQYKYIADYVPRNPECEPRVIKEYEISKDMVDLLPRSMEQYLE